jgi:DNA invertase Pin-like site-specific DNA recombinase
MERIAHDQASEPVKAVAYMRTSSATNVGSDKDSEQRQRSAIEGYAKRTRMSVVDWFYDPAVSGADPIETRPGFAALLDRIESNGVRVVLIEDATRFARDLIAQELGIVVLVSRGVRVITANGDDLCDTSDPSRVMMRQIAGAFAQYEKARLVARLRRAREIKGKMGGRKSLAEKSRAKWEAASPSPRHGPMSSSSRASSASPHAPVSNDRCARLAQCSRREVSFPKKQGGHSRPPKWPECWLERVP